MQVCQLLHAHLNVPMHLTVNGICHMNGPLWWFSKIEEAIEPTDSPDHRLWSTPADAWRSFRLYLGVMSPPLSVNRLVEWRSRIDLALSSSASSLSILEVRFVIVLQGGHESRKEGERELSMQKIHNNHTTNYHQLFLYNQHRKKVVASSASLLNSMWEQHISMGVDTLLCTIHVSSKPTCTCTCTLIWNTTVCQRG